MFFEGAEKKIEIVIAPGQRPLRARGRAYFEKLVHACNASILSSISNEYCDAYLLSESSLFVWDDRLLMITCGTTKLAQSALMAIEDFGAENIQSLIFQRKNEYLANLQHSSFLQDVEELKKHIDGKAMRFGKIHSHHNLIFHLNKPFSPPADDTTTELLMYDFAPEVCGFFTRPGLTKAEIRDFMRLPEVMPGFVVDDFVFEPFGYSLNALLGDDYLTIHITPQENSPYISFETNLNLGANKSRVMNHLLEVFKPASFDVITFNTSNEFDVYKTYNKASNCNGQLSCGYDVEFDYYYKNATQEETPFFFD